MPSLDEIGEPTEEEREIAETAIEAINGSDRLGVVPFVDKESDDRVLFLVAIRETDEDDDELSMHPIGPVYGFEETTDRFEMPDELAV